MPYYEYRCNVCGQQYEKFQRITDDSRPPCESCGTVDVTRLISHTSFVLKGSGWYITDYARKNSPSTSKTPDSKESGSATASKPAEPAKVDKPAATEKKD